MTQYTPGPWHVERIGSGYRSQQEKGMMHRIIADSGDHRHYEIGTIYYKPMAEEGEANARLIAAAPELLEALRTMLYHFQPTAEIGPDEIENAVAEANAAIAKAENRESLERVQ